MKYSFDRYIFDFDGTIVNLQVNWSEIRSILKVKEKEHNLPSGLKLYEKVMFISQTDPEVLDKIYTVESSIDKPNFTVNQNVLDFIKRDLKTFYIISNNHTKTIKLVLSKLGLIEKCEAIIGIDQVRATKPNPNPFIILNEKLKTKISKCESVLYVGDRPTDEEFAQNTNMSYLDYKEI